MGNLNDSKKRDFVSQLIVLLEQNTQLLTDKGFDPAAKIDQLKQKMTSTEDGIRKYENKEIYLPNESQFHPSKKYFQEHKTKFGYI